MSKMNSQQDKSSLENYQNIILQGDSWELVDVLPEQSVQMIVTSPPYFQQRKYIKKDTDGSLEFGREATVQEYVTKLVLLFQKLKLVLKDNGTIWLNLGDKYLDNQLLGVPWRVALALQDDGWLLRSEIIWYKPNAMPSSVKNRPTTDHEHIFLLAKSKDYYYNADAIREQHVTFSTKSKMKGGRNHFGKRDGTPENGKNKGDSNLHDGRWDQAFHPLGRNKRTVWEIPVGKFRDAHFAVFPERLIENCILAGSTEEDIVLDPFMGAGTTALVAKRHSRHYIGIELVAAYIKMAEERIQKVQMQLL
ncbi:MAG: site-specific DNA-methyltransferase [Anaerolineae bacterium]|nr:site-specific DNA-methyltransferase [Anaerolineae bacterium]MDQ7033672.1 site-specific DNA-methyltransferase [Anaerolineae bacterium]